MNSTRNFGFVILHYKSFEMTKLCVNQLLAIFPVENVKIVIVDNGSNNNSGESLVKYYDSKKNVTVILNEKNIGFARGNNIGFEYLKKLNCLDFMVIMNNDIIINDDLFIDKVISIYNKNKFDVLGPDIYCLADDYHQNPIRENGYTLEQIKKLIKYHKQRKYFPFVYYLKEKILKVSRPTDNIFDRSKEYLNPVLHGAFYIFSRNFVKNRQYAFCPDTFLYAEEDILYEECKSSGFLMMYSPQIFVTHLEHFSTKMSLNSEYQRLNFMNNNALESLKILKKKMF